MSEHPIPLDQVLLARHQAEVLGNYVLALARVVEAYPRGDAEARFHLRQLFGWLLRHLDARYNGKDLLLQLGVCPELGEVAASILAQRVVRQPTQPVVGEALALLVDAERSGEAFVARLAFAPADAPVEPPHMTARFAAALEEAQRAVLRLLLARRGLPPLATLCATNRFSLRVPGAGAVLSVDGASIGAAAAVAAFSRWSGQPVPADLAFTGAVGADGRLGRVGHLDLKLTAASREQPWLRAIFIPNDGTPVSGDPRVRPIQTAAELLEATFGEAALSAAFPGETVDLDGALQAGLVLYERSNDFAAALAVFEAVLGLIATERGQIGAPCSRRREEFLARWRAGACLLHLGALEQAQDHLEHAQTLGEALWQAEELSPQDYLGLRGNRAVLLRDTYCYREAEALLRENLRLQAELRQDKRQRARTLGNLGELLALVGRYTEAEKSLREALESLRAVYPDEVPRELCYLGDLFLRQGQTDLALERYEEGLAANRRVVHGAPLNAAFLHFGLLRAQAALGHPDIAVRHAELALRSLAPNQPFPRQLVLKHRGLAELARGALLSGRADLRAAADPTYARSAYLRFGLATANAELALHLFAGGAEADSHEAEQCVRSFNASAIATPGLARALGRSIDLERLLAEEPKPSPALVEGLRQLCTAFPYG